MPLVIRQTTVFRRDIKRLKKRGLDLQKLEILIRLLASEEILPERYRDHSLVGNWFGYRDCHIQPDWLLIYKISEDELFLARTGTHAELFGK
jgi:mRNA interferase YafQ